MARETRPTIIRLTCPSLATSNECPSAHARAPPPVEEDDARRIMAPAQMGHGKQLDVSAAGGGEAAPSLRGTAAREAAATRGCFDGADPELARFAATRDRGARARHIAGDDIARRASARSRRRAMSGRGARRCSENV